MLQWLRTRERYHVNIIRSIEAATRAFEIDAAEFKLHDSAEIECAIKGARSEIGIGYHFGSGESIASYMAVFARACEMLKRRRLGGEITAP